MGKQHSLQPARLLWGSEELRCLNTFHFSSFTEQNKLNQLELSQLDSNLHTHTTSPTDWEELMQPCEDGLIPCCGRDIAENWLQLWCIWQGQWLLGGIQKKDWFFQILLPIQSEVPFLSWYVSLLLSEFRLLFTGSFFYSWTLKPSHCYPKTHLGIL